MSYFRYKISFNLFLPNPSARFLCKFYVKLKFEMKIPKWLAFFKLHVLHSQQDSFVLNLENILYKLRKYFACV